jgi:hypothetical protein
MDKVLLIANQIKDLLATNTNVKARFTEHIDRFCKMVEDYGQALQPCIEWDEQVKKDIEKLTPEQLQKYKKNLSDKEGLPPLIGVSPTDVHPLPENWVQIDPDIDNKFVRVPRVYYRPNESVNPLLWFGLYGNPHRKPTDDEILMCDYVLLAIIHDYELRQPIDRPLFSDKYSGKWFERDKFRDEVSKFYNYPYQRSELFHHYIAPEEKISQLSRALEYVQADLAAAETERNTTPAKWWGIPTCLGKILEKVLYVFTRSFWDAVFDRRWPK